jgi:hypothetical protein
MNIFKYLLNLYHPALAVNKTNKNIICPLIGQYWLETEIWYKQHEGFLKQTNKIMFISILDLRYFWPTLVFGGCYF